MRKKIELRLTALFHHITFRHSSCRTKTTHAYAVWHQITISPTWFARTPWPIKAMWLVQFEVKRIYERYLGSKQESLDLNSGPLRYRFNARPIELSNQLEACNLWVRNTRVKSREPHGQWRNRKSKPNVFKVINLQHAIWTDKWVHLNQLES